MKPECKNAREELSGIALDRPGVTKEHMRTAWHLEQMRGGVGWPAKADNRARDMTCADEVRSCVCADSNTTQRHVQTDFLRKQKQAQLAAAYSRRDLRPNYHRRWRA